MFAMIELLLCALPLCFGRMMDSMPNEEVERNSLFMHLKDGSQRTLKPTLNIRNSPSDYLDVAVGESKFLECEAGGTPPPSIHWLKDGQKMPQNFYESIHATTNVIDSTLGLGFTRSRMFLDCATLSDAGSYTCVADNEYMRRFKTSKVIVTDGTENSAVCLARKNFGQAARVYMWTHTRLEIMGSDVQLFCRATGNPEPHMVWKGPNNKVLNDSKKYEILPNGDLIIRKIKWADMGGYTCQAKNSDGSDEATVFLYPTLPEDDEAEF